MKFSPLVQAQHLLYRKYRARLIKAIHSGRFAQFTARKKAALLARLQRYERQLTRYGVAVASVASLMLGTATAQVYPVGTEFLANTAYTTSSQLAPAIAADTDGDYVLVWESNGQDGSGSGIYGQRYNASGVAQGAAFQVNTFTTSSQQNPAVAMDGTGNFVVVWNGNGTGDTDGVFARRYNAAGTALDANEFRVNTGTSGYQQAADVAMDLTGDFVVVWESSGGDGAGYGVFSRRYNAAGVAQDANDVLVNTTTASNQRFPAVDMDDAGNYAVAWGSYTQDGNDDGLYAKRFSAAGGVQGVGEFRVNTYTTSSQHYSDVALDSDGDVVVVWTSRNQDGSGNGIYGQRYNNAGTAQGPEFRVNTFTTGSQWFPAVELDADGDFVVTWQSSGQDGSSYGVYAQRYNALGAAQGGETRVNSYTTNSQSRPAIAMEANGDFVIAWTGEGTGENAGVFAQMYSIMAPPHEPYPAGNEFLVNTAYTTGQQSTPAVATDSDGDYVVVWQTNGQDASFSDGIYAQRYNATGVAQGAAFQVNTFATGNQQNPAVAMDGTGNFVVVWNGNGSGDPNGVFARRYNAAGTALDVNEFRVNTGIAGYQQAADVAMDLTGDFVVVWESSGGDASGYGVVARRYNAAGVAQDGSDVLVNTTTASNQRFPAVDMDDAGNYVVSWGSYTQDGNDDGLYAKRFSAAGVAQGVGEFRVNTYTTSSQHYSDVALDSDGDFVVIWTSRNQDGSGNGIYGQRYNNAGTAQGAEFRVNTFTTGSQWFPAVELDADGDFVVTWQSSGQDGSSYGVYGQRYNALGVTQGGEFRVNPYTINNQNRPAIAMEANGDFVVAWMGEGTGDNSGVFAQMYSIAALPGIALTVSSNSGTEAAASVITVTVTASSAVAGDQTVVLGITGGGITGADYTLSNSTITILNGQTQGTATFTITNDALSELSETAMLAITSVSIGVQGSTASQLIQITDNDFVQDSRIGGEIAVNTFTTNNQTNPATAMDSDGDYVVVWEGEGAGDSDGIFAQRYDAAGVALGAVFQVNGQTSGPQSNPAVAMDSDGDFVIVWQGQPFSYYGYSIYAQRYNPSGDPQGEFSVVASFSTTISYTEPAVAMDGSGDFVVAWRGGGAGDTDGIFAKLYSATGSALGSAFLVNTFTTNGQVNPAAAMDSDGDFVVVWNGAGQGGTFSDVYAQRYNASGVAQGSEFRVNTFTNDNEYVPSVAMDNYGNFVVTWFGQGYDGSGDGVFAQRYNAAGTVQGAEFQVNTTTVSDQNAPSVAMDGDGDFVVAWRSNLQDGSNSGIYAKRFNPSGGAIGAEFLVNSYTTNAQDLPAIAMSSGGDFVVAWQSDGQDGSNSGIYSQLYSIVIPPLPTVDLSVSANTGTEAGATVITVTATASTAVSGDQTVALGVTGTGITTGDYSLSGSTITILSGQTQGSVTFTITNDAIDEASPETATLTISSPSAGIALGSTVSQNIAITDNDAAGITVTESGGNTAVTEGGATDSYTVVLTSEPTDDVVINFTGTQVANPSSVTFTSLNWNTPQTVTVTATDDAIDETTPHAGSVSHSVSSSDANYNNFSLSAVSVAVTDNDAAGVAITQSGGSTDIAEGGATDSYAVVLTTAPSANVTVTITPDGQQTTNPPSLTFSTANWSIPQTVTVMAVDDAASEGSHSGSIAHSATSSDASYNGISIGSVTVNITDNDAAPEIAVLGNAVLIADGAVTVSAGDHTLIPAQPSGTVFTRTFTLKNDVSATGPLTVSGLAIDNAFFGIGTILMGGVPQTLPFAIAPNSEATFEVRYTAMGAGTRNATLTLTSDDADEGTYTFRVQGSSTTTGCN